MRTWKLVDESEIGLDVEKVIAILPGVGTRRDDILDVLEQSGFARQILLGRSRRDIVCVLQFCREDKEDAFGLLESLDVPFSWDEVIAEDRAIEAENWISIAQSFSGREHLHIDAIRRIGR